MFTGIITEVGKVLEATTAKLVVAAGKVNANMELGQSVAVNGVCLTVTAFNERYFSVEVMPQTLRLTNLGRLRPAEKVNLENALALGGQVGGHLVQGHIDATGKVTTITREAEAKRIKISASPEVMRYVVDKGFIAVDGISLTVADTGSNWFGISIVGYTLTNTTIVDWRAGTLVNLETDIIGKYVAKLASARSGTVTRRFLQEQGFLVT
ncbi:MAG: riboflavin synthase [Dehalococcoidia bacterium]|jgi:riboflavin synthase|nr:MAG: riboflavin synthase [Dehalococcoidia bacterium]